MKTNYDLSIYVYYLVYFLHVGSIHLGSRRLIRTKTLTSRVINSSVLDFAPWLELHHIVLLRDQSFPKLACAIDFSPLNQTTLETLKKLVLGQYVPAEIRINWIDSK